MHYLHLVAPAIKRVIHIIKRLELSVFLLQNVSLEPPRRGLAGLVSDELLTRHGENVIELLQSPLLGLRHEEEDHDKRAYVQSGVETECTCVSSVSMRLFGISVSKDGLHEPVGVKAARMAGNEMESTAAQNKQVATAHPMPTSRWLRGNTSAEYVKGTGPSPGE